MSRKTAATAATIALTGLLAAGVGFAVVDSRETQAQATQAAQDYSPAVTYTPPPTPDTALFIGDSYTAGVGSTGSGDRWTSLVAKEMRWIEANYGQGGTGYVTTAGRNGCGREACPTYPDRLKEAEGQVNPDVVFIAGGQNDFATYRTDPEKVDNAIRATFTQVHEQYPEANIIAVGPSTPWENTDTARGMDDTVQKSAESTGATYISLLDPPVIEQDMILEDGGHVGPDGHKAIAERVLDTLRD